MSNLTLSNYIKLSVDEIKWLIVFPIVDEFGKIIYFLSDFEYFFFKMLLRFWIFGLKLLFLQANTEFKKHLSKIVKKIDSPDFVVWSFENFEDCVFSFFFGRLENDLMTFGCRFKINPIFYIWVSDVYVVAITNVFFSFIFEIYEVEQWQVFGPYSHSYDIFNSFLYFSGHWDLNDG